MIDVLIPCRNAPNVVSLMLTHLWCYGMPSGLVRSVTLLDNVSAHPAMDAVLDFAVRQPQVQVIRHEQNLGVWCSINRGLALSDRADLVLVLTSDVLIGPDLLPGLLHAFQTTRIAYLGPDNGVMGLAEHARVLQWDPSGGLRIERDYNGACWLMHWSRLREQVGWYDPRFYICAGDIDYIERLHRAAVATNDATLEPHVIRGLHICHLDKQTRRHDATALGDAQMEIRDLTRFRDKWLPTDPSIAARHPVPTVEHQVAYKAQQLGGWTEAKVG